MCVHEEGFFFWEEILPATVDLTQFLRLNRKRLQADRESWNRRKLTRNKSGEVNMIQWCGSEENEEVVCFFVVSVLSAWLLLLYGAGSRDRSDRRGGLVGCRRQFSRRYCWNRFLLHFERVRFILPLFASISLRGNIACYSRLDIVVDGFYIIPPHQTNNTTHNTTRKRVVTSVVASS